MADNEKYFTKLVDGQLSVATVSQSGEIIPEESRPGDVYTTALVNTDNGPQLCVKTFDLNGGGGGGGGTVDQTYDPTSTNAQSGTAVAEAVAPALKNQATTGTYSVNILGDSGYISGNCATVLGIEARQKKDSVVIGYAAIARDQSATVVGRSAVANEGGVSVGYSASCTGTGSVAIGRNAVVSSSPGYSSIQIGQGTNSEDGTFQVKSYKVLDANGKIPSERLPSNVLTKNDIKYWYSGFSNSAYLLLPCSGWFSGNWEFQTRIRLSSFPASGGRYLFSQNATKSFELGYTYQGNIVYFMSTDGSSWVSNSGYTTGLTLTANTDTLLNISFDGTGYTVKISTDGGTTWQSDTNTTSTQVYASGTNIILGNSQDKSWAASTMYLCSTDTYFKKAGTTVFSGSPFDYTVNGALTERILWD